MDQDAGIIRQQQIGYWNARKHMLYYKSVFQYVAVAGFTARSAIDVGSASAEYLQWFGWIPERTLLDFAIPSRPDGITCIETDFYDFRPVEKYDIALCCQVLEHVDDPHRFCSKLKEVAERLVITVPYKWSGNAPGHIHDPVDEEKLRLWMGVAPNNSQVVYEPFREARLVAYYDLVAGPTHRFSKDFIMRAIAERSEEWGGFLP